MEIHVQAILILMNAYHLLLYSELFYNPDPTFFHWSKQHLRGDLRKALGIIDYGIFCFARSKQKLLKVRILFKVWMAYIFK